MNGLNNRMEESEEIINKLEDTIEITQYNNTEKTDFKKMNKRLVDL